MSLFTVALWPLHLHTSVWEEGDRWQESMQCVCLQWLGRKESTKTYIPFPPPSAIRVSSRVLASGVHSSWLRMLANLQGTSAMLPEQWSHCHFPSLFSAVTGSQSTLLWPTSFFVPGVCVCSMTWLWPASASGLLLSGRLFLGGLWFLWVIRGALGWASSPPGLWIGGVTHFPLNLHRPICPLLDVVTRECRVFLRSFWGDGSKQGSCWVFILFYYLFIYLFFGKVRKELPGTGDRGFKRGLSLREKFYLFSDIFVDLCVKRFVCVRICTHLCAWWLWRSQKTSDALKQELSMITNHHVGAE